MQSPPGDSGKGHGEDKLKPVDICIAHDDPQGSVATRGTDNRYRQQKGKAGSGIGRQAEKTTGCDGDARSRRTRNQSQGLGQTDQQDALRKLICSSLTSREPRASAIHSNRPKPIVVQAMMRTSRK